MWYGIVIQNIKHFNLNYYSTLTRNNCYSAQNVSSRLWQWSKITQFCRSQQKIMWLIKSHNSVPALYLQSQICSLIFYCNQYITGAPPMDSLQVAKSTGKSTIFGRVDSIQTNNNLDWKWQPILNCWFIVYLRNCSCNSI